jgi:hypothetical protein
MSETLMLFIALICIACIIDRPKVDWDEYDRWIADHPDEDEFR